MFTEAKPLQEETLTQIEELEEKTAPGASYDAFDLL